MADTRHPVEIQTAPLPKVAEFAFVFTVVVVAEFALHQPAGRCASAVDVDHSAIGGLVPFTGHS
jgi:hypothetical protein